MGISKRLIVIITLSQFVMGVLIVGVSYRLVSGILEDMYVQRIREAARNFAASASIGVIFKDVAVLEKLAGPLLRNEGIRGIELLDAQRKPIFSKGMKTSSFLEMPIEVSSGESVIFNPSQEEKPLGIVRVFYNMKVLEQRLSRILVDISVIALVVILATNFLAYILISKAVIVPMNNLLQAVRDVSAGNLDVGIEGGNLPETRELADAFRFMVDSIKEHQQALRKSYEEMARNQSLAEIGKFSLMIAHEIKNPLSVIKGSLDILKKKELQDELREQMIGYIEEEVERIDRLVKEFLQLSRPDKLNIRKVHLKDVLCAIGEKMSVVDSGTVEVEAQEGVFEADVYVLEKVLSNLISNSFEAGATKVKLTGRFNKDNVEILVEDNGKGIPQEEMENIFKPFYTTKEGGTGLGLSVVLQAVYALGGSLNVESKEGEGTVFKITFPRRREA
jgi:signal transduction histidine kinase